MIGINTEAPTGIRKNDFFNISGFLRKNFHFYRMSDQKKFSPLRTESVVNKNARFRKLFQAHSYRIAVKQSSDTDLKESYVNSLGIPDKKKTI